MNKLRDQQRDALKTCHDDTDEVKGIYDKLSETCSQEKQRLTSERDEQKTAAEQKQTELKTALEEREHARADAASCSNDRDDLRKQLEAAKRVTTAPPTPAGTGTGVPTSTGSPPPPSPSPGPIPPGDGSDPDPYN